LPASSKRVIRTWQSRENDLKEALVKVAVLHQDETGMRVKKEGWWVYVCATDRLTHYGEHSNVGAGKRVMLASCWRRRKGTRVSFSTFRLLW
jgi:hypothetical protein